MDRRNTQKRGITIAKARSRNHARSWGRTPLNMRIYGWPRMRWGKAIYFVLFLDDWLRLTVIKRKRITESVRFCSIEVCSLRCSSARTVKQNGGGTGKRVPGMKGAWRKKQKREQRHDSPHGRHEWQTTETDIKKGRERERGRKRNKLFGVNSRPTPYTDWGKRAD